jgi:hypothetical protein
MPVLTHNTPSKPRKTLEGGKKQQEETTMLLFGFHGFYLRILGLQKNYAPCTVRRTVGGTMAAHTIKRTTKRTTKQHRQTVFSNFLVSGIEDVVYLLIHAP